MPTGQVEVLSVHPGQFRNLRSSSRVGRTSVIPAIPDLSGPLSVQQRHKDWLNEGSVFKQRLACSMPTTKGRQKFMTSAKQCLRDKCFSRRAAVLCVPSSHARAPSASKNSSRYSSICRLAQFVRHGSAAALRGRASSEKRSRRPS